MKIALTLTSFAYSGWSIGRDIRAEIEVAGRTSVYERRMRPLYFTRPDIPLGMYDTEEGQTISVLVRVIERDRVYPDHGETRLVITIPDTIDLPKVYTAELEVPERRFFFWKARARFSVGIEARVMLDAPHALKQYRSYKGEDYNQHDDIIAEAVQYWNARFAEETDSPDEHLDPNLVKAICYQESRVGNDPESNGLVDIMQVGNPRDPALKALSGEKTEYWVHDDKLIALKYLEAKVETPRDSVFWGVRWLYHKAHQNVRLADGGWGNEWWSWKEAVGKYGPGTPEYVENIWKVYKDGISDRDGGTKLWSFAAIVCLLLLPFLSLGLFQKDVALHTLTASLRSMALPEELLDFSDSDIRRSFEETFAYRRAEYRDGIVVVRSDMYQSLFAAAEDDGDDWSEIFAVGRVSRGSLQWLPVFDDGTDTIYGVASLGFVKLRGFEEPMLEVWLKTHRGYGSIDLYRITESELVLAASIPAVDTDREDHFEADGFPEYGGGYNTCGSTYEGGMLHAEYSDRNGDGVDDIILTGVQIVECDKIVGKDENGYIVARVDEVERSDVEEVHYMEAPRRRSGGMSPFGRHMTRG